MRIFCVCKAQAILAETGAGLGKKKKSLRDVQKPWDHCHGKGISKLMTLSIRRALAQLCQ
jgi:hypothetical protein